MADGGNLRPKQEAFVAAYIGPAKGNATEAARLAGYEGSYAVLRSIGSENLTKPNIAAAIEDYRASVRAEGLASLQNRVDEYNERWFALRRIREERAADPWLADVPGGTTGLVLKQLKQVKHLYEADPDDEDSKSFSTTVELWEHAVDTGYLREIRELEKHAAQDLGQWKETTELTGKDGEPLLIAFRERSDGPQ